jgi:hypothetical protein
LEFLILTVVVDFKQPCDCIRQLKFDAETHPVVKTSNSLMGDAVDLNDAVGVCDVDVAIKPAVSCDPLEDTEDDEGRCGYGNCTPDCLQKCHKPPWLLAAMCFMVIVQGRLVFFILKCLVLNFKLSSS